MRVRQERSTALTTTKWLLLLVVTLAIGAGAYYLPSKLLFRTADQTDRTKQQIKQVPKPEHAESRMLVIGDVYFGRYINDWSMASELKYAYPFSALDQFKRDNYDAWIANLECPVTNNPKLSSAQENATLTFDCHPDYLAEASKWFDVFSLANNHTDNQSKEGLEETRKHLDKNKIQYFGTYEPEDYKHLCDTIAIPAKVRMSNSKTEDGHLPVVWCGYHGVFKTPSEESIGQITKYAEILPVIAMPHSGAEYKSAPDEIKTSLYRSMIDAGADMVIGGHPHWVQNSEAYKGKLIMYSLGNFIFDQQNSLEVTRSVLLKIKAKVSAESNPSLAKWLEIGKHCQVYKDSCLELAKDADLAKLELSYDFDIEASDNRNKLVRRASRSELDSIKSRLNWDSTINNL